MNMSHYPAKRGCIVLMSGPPFRFGTVTKTYRLGGHSGLIAEVRMPNGTIIDLFTLAKSTGFVKRRC